MSSESCLIIAGEKSGEDHAMSFLPELVKKDIAFYGVGGEKLRELGVETLYDIADFSSMGLTEVIGKIPFYFKAMNHILHEVEARKTKTAILIDFQGFNLKLAQKLKKKNVNVLYYVAPQAWAWKPWRAKALEKCVHTLFTIIPFEKEWFSSRGVSKIIGIPHPLLNSSKKDFSNIPERSFNIMSKRKRRILLLPGSRKFEVENLLPEFLEGLNIFSEQGIDYELGIVKSETVFKSDMEEKSIYNKEWGSDCLNDALNWADFAIAASGTVTLSCALFEVPTIVFYRISMVNEFIFRLIVPYDGYVSLANIFHQDEVFPENLHYLADKYRVSYWLQKYFSDEKLYDVTVKKLKKTKNLLTGDSLDVSEYMENTILNKEAL